MLIDPAPSVYGIGSAPPAPERTALYRMFDAQNVLLYIGISNNFGRRWAQHMIAAPWYPDVHRQTVVWFPSREQAEQAERDAIKAENPKYNIIHAAKSERPAAAGTRSDPFPKRQIHLSASRPAEGGWEEYLTNRAEIIAPGTYLLTLAYDPEAESPVRIAQLLLVDAGDDIAAEYGGTVLPRCAGSKQGAPSHIARPGSRRDCCGDTLAEWRSSRDPAT